MKRKNLILIVDDDQVFRAATAYQFQELGFNTTELHSGKDVVDVITKTKPKLVVLDMVMEGKEGMETLLELTELEDCPPIIAVSAERVYLNAALAMGAEHALLKPILPEKFEALVREIDLPTL